MIFLKVAEFIIAIFHYVVMYFLHLWILKISAIILVEKSDFHIWNILGDTKIIVQKR